MRFRLVGVDCTSGTCSIALGRHVGKAPGVVEFYLNPMDSMLTIRYDPTKTTLDAVTAGVRATGFTAIGPIMGKRPSKG